jgi:hypothetical protein
LGSSDHRRRLFEGEFVTESDRDQAELLAAHPDHPDSQQHRHEAQNLKTKVTLKQEHAAALEKIGRLERQADQEGGNLFTMADMPRYRAQGGRVRMVNF